MSAANERIAELLDRWLASIELHAQYLELDAGQYARVQDWPKHQRPTKWVVELARARLVELKRHLDERQAKGDAAFAESLELMAFLTTLLGSEHIDRFIPLATGKAPAAATPSRPPESQADPSPATPAPAEPRKSTGDTTTKQKLAVRPRPAAASGQGSRAKAAPAAAKSAPARPKSSDKVIALVISDAVRFLSWGREWPQLASSISRLADRPTEPEILAILRAHRADIEARARRPPD
jgi:hypothetical protein